MNAWNDTTDNWERQRCHGYGDLHSKGDLGAGNIWRCINRLQLSQTAGSGRTAVKREFSLHGDSFNLNAQHVRLRMRECLEAGAWSMSSCEWVIR